jgi:hypothetical protein
MKKEYGIRVVIVNYTQKKHLILGTIIHLHGEKLIQVKNEIEVGTDPSLSRQSNNVSPVPAAARNDTFTSKE